MKSSPLPSLKNSTGIVLVDKPVQLGSAPLVGKLRRKLDGAKVGHTGTLDRFASGLMILLVGRATSLADYFLKLPKSYLATFSFGRSTDTHDPEGDTLAEIGSVEATKFLEDSGEKITNLIQGWLEQTTQHPPAYSALKIGGRRYSDLARQGDEKLPPERPIKVFQVTDPLIEPVKATVTVELRVSSGCYIRSFARDLGSKLDFPVHLGQLVRTSVGDFSLNDERTWHDLESQPEVIALEEGITEWPRFEIEPLNYQKVKHGQKIPIYTGLPEGSDFMICSRDNRFLAWAQSEKNGYLYKKVFSD